MPRQPGWLALKQYADAIIRSFIVPFGAVFIERSLNTGVFRESDMPYWWALTVMAFMAGRLVGDTLTLWEHHRPHRNRAQHFLVCFIGVQCLLVGTGYVRKLQGLVIIRFLTGLASKLLWSQEQTSWYLAGKTPTTFKDGMLISPMEALGCGIGGLIGGFAFPEGNDVVVKQKIALYPGCLAAVSIAVPAVLVLAVALAKRRPAARKNGIRNLGHFSAPQQEDVSLTSPAGTLRDSVQALDSCDGIQQIPINFLKACNNNRGKAWSRFQQTLAWRTANDIDHILSRPQPHFESIKQYYPHFIHGRSLRDEIIIYEFPGKMDISKLKASGVGPLEMGQHYAFFMEFLFRHLDPREEARIMTVLDIGGISLSMLSQDVLEVLKITSEIMQSHYPERVVRIVVVNVPFFLGSVWKAIAGVLPKSVQERIELSSDAAHDLRKYISVDNIPQCYKGQSQLDFGHSMEEIALKSVVDKVNSVFHSTEREGNNGVPHLGVEPTALRGGSRAPSSSSPVVRPYMRVESAAAAPQRPSSPTSKRWSLFERFSSKRKQAYLGYENRFVFDQGRQMWVLEDELPLMEEERHQGETCVAPSTPGIPDISMSHNSPLRRQDAAMSSSHDAVTVEEQGLVLAIQAAHYAERLRSQQRQAHVPYPFSDTTACSGASQRHTDRFGEVESSAYKPSSWLVMQVFILHMAWSGLMVSFETMGPLWLMVPIERGGLELAPRGVGMLMASVCACLLLITTLGPFQLLQTAWRSPLHTFRRAAGYLILSTFSVAFRPTVGQGLSALVVWLYYGVLLTVVVVALALGYHASATMLHVVLRQKCAQPPSAVRAASTTGKLSGPLIAAVIMSWSLQEEAPYPLDSRLVFNACSILCMGLYVVSLLLHVSIVGDFGVSDSDGGAAEVVMPSREGSGARLWRQVEGHRKA